MGCRFQDLSVHRQVTKSQTGRFSVMLIGTVRRITSATSQLSNHSFFGYTNLLHNLRTPLAFLVEQRCQQMQWFRLLHVLVMGQLSCRGETLLQRMKWGQVLGDTFRLSGPSSIGSVASSGSFFTRKCDIKKKDRSSTKPRGADGP